MNVNLKKDCMSDLQRHFMGNPCMNNDKQFSKETIFEQRTKV